MRQDKKAQVVIADLFMALIIFAILLVAIVGTWNHYLVRADERIVYGDMTIKAMQLADTLVKSPGYPDIWDESSVDIIGLAVDDRELSTDKMHNFTNMSEAAIKEKMKIKNYDFYFSLKTIDGSINITHGSNISGTQAATIRRYVIYENKTAELLFTLWQ